MEVKDNVRDMIEQYRIYIEEKEKFIDRTFSTNKFFLVFCTALFTLIFFSTEHTTSSYGLTLDILLALIGIITCLLWLNNVNVYDVIISIKLKKVIDKLEEVLPLQPHLLEKKEFEEYRKTKGKFNLMKLSYTGSQKTMIIGMLAAFVMITILNVAPKYFNYIMQTILTN